MLSALLLRLRPCFVDAQQVLFREGDFASEAYFLLSGTMGGYVRTTGKQSMVRCCPWRVSLSV